MKLLLVLCGMAMSVWGGPAWAQQPSTLPMSERPPTPMGYDTAEIRRQIEASGLTPAEVRARLQAAGLDSRMMDAFLTTPQRGDALALQAASRQQPVDSLALALETLGLSQRTDSTRTDSLPSFLRIDPEWVFLRDRYFPPLRDSLLAPFGYRVFRTLAQGEVEAPAVSGPVSNDYRIGPGDVLTLTVWGGANLNLMLPVDRSGNLTVPSVGPVQVAGVRRSEAEARVRRALRQIYSTISPDGRGGSTFVELGVDRVRAVRVVVQGEVRRPGTFTLGGFSTAITALYAAGGPTYNGSLRSVRIVRDGETFAELDVYPYLLSGEMAGDVPLQDGDVVFVMRSGPRVAIEGEVRHPAVYELKPGETLASALAFAGGLSPRADANRIWIDRTLPQDQRSANRQYDRLIVEASAIGQLPAEPVFDRDVIRVEPLRDWLTQYVVVDGPAVRQPGPYAWRAGMRASELIARAGGVREDALRARVHLIRTQPDSTLTLLALQLPGFGGAGDVFDPLLQPQDTLRLFSRAQLRVRPEVAVRGMVPEPGEYPFYSGMTVEDLVLRAGGLLPGADPTGIDVVRPVDPNDPNSASRTFSVPLDTSFARGNGFALSPFDAIFVRTHPDWPVGATVMIEGEVRFPGRYRLRSRYETLSDLVARAGGITEFGFVEGGQFERENLGPVQVDFREILSRPDNRSNLTLQPGDRVFIPQRPTIVRVEGQVNLPAAVQHVRGADLDYYIRSAGGLRWDADRKRIYVIQPGGTAMTRRRFLVFSWLPDRVEPGATIVVPERPPAQENTFLRDATTLVSLVASTATTIFLLTQTLRQ